ncbi:ABC transporter substrate-binding protein [Roseateles toxinivorans]|uniref:Iron complex transport system substrate-binding protein n=1 Tax=Roseateles toxinivorans TaxID=270368 RepID=A0A4R6QLM8_9BURK|nr:helical backbone metal receptor [Roseateles toxinivorans]TDP71193.1 iron complex transport system substrate-binding protein [Roseateles toxinivorans]
MKPLFVLLAALLSQGGAVAADVVIKDDVGQTTRWAAPPQRIVSLLPSLTETVCELGACARLIGVDRYSNHPASVNALPKLGGLDDTNVEMIVALKPDVVLVAPSSRVTERLQGLGLKVVTLEAKSYADVQRVLGKVGELLAVPDAPRLWRQIEAGVAAAAQAMPPAAKGTLVYYEVASGPYAAGETSFMGETLIKLGARNIIPASLGPFPKINPEFVVRANPQLIMMGQRDAGGIYQRPGWDRIAAIRDKKVCIFTREQSDMLGRPGPRIAEAAQIMARCLREMSEKKP